MVTVAASASACHPDARPPRDARVPCTAADTTWDPRAEVDGTHGVVLQASCSSEGVRLVRVRGRDSVDGAIERFLLVAGGDSSIVTQEGLGFLLYDLRAGSTLGAWEPRSPDAWTMWSACDARVTLVAREARVRYRCTGDPAEVERAIPWGPPPASERPSD